MHTKNVKPRGRNWGTKKNIRSEEGRQHNRPRKREGSPRYSQILEFETRRGLKRSGIRDHQTEGERNRKEHRRIHASPTTIVASQDPVDTEFLCLPSDLHTSSALTTSAGFVLESVRGAAERTQYRNLVVIASCSSVEAGAVELKQRSVK